MAELKPAYLVSGDDDVKIDAWRGRVRSRAEEEGGRGALELHDAASEPPEAIAAELAALTFATGTRYLLVDGVEAWRAGALEPLERALAAMPPDTVLVLVARGKAPERLGKAVAAAGGEVREYEAPRAQQLWRWVAERAREQGLELDASAAKALVAAVGARQQRLARELERLALLAYPETRLDAEQVARLAAGEATAQAYELADAVVARDAAAALALAERLHETGERPGQLLYPVVRRLREVQRAAELLDAGVGERDAAGQLKLPPWLARRVLAQARGADRDALERAICTFADLELELRGGGALRGDAFGDTPRADLLEQSALTLALARATAQPA